MINPIEQRTFSSQELTGSSFHLHTHPRKFSNEVLIFIHGFGGKGYETWDNFPAIMFDRHSFDVAIFDYVSSKRRLKGGGSSVDTYIAMVVQYIDNLEKNYESIYLIGHSLGGVIAEAAVMRHVQDRAMRRKFDLTPVAGIVLFASPRAGVPVALPPIRNMLPEGSWLTRRSAEIREIEKFYSTYIESDISSPVSSKIFIPRFVCRGISDRVVDHFSAEYGVPAQQRINIIGNHRTISKPASEHSEQVIWLTQNIVNIQTARQRIREQLFAAEGRQAIETRRKARTARTLLVTEFWAQGRDAALWTTIYNEVRASVSYPDPEVRDFHEEGTPFADLLISVTDAEIVLNDANFKSVFMARALSRKRADDVLAVGFSPIGEKSADAASQIEHWLRERGWPSFTFVNESPDIEVLRSVLSQWISAVARRRRPQTTRYSASSPEQIVIGDSKPIDPRAGD